MDYPEHRPEDVGFWQRAGAWAGGLRKRRWGPQPRDRRVQVRFSDAELTELQRLAHRLGMAPGSWIAEMALAYARGELHPVPLDWQRVLGELMRTRVEVVRVGTLLNQITRHAHYYDQLPETTARALEQLTAVLRHLDTHERSARHDATRPPSS